MYPVINWIAYMVINIPFNWGSSLTPWEQRSSRVSSLWRCLEDRRSGFRSLHRLFQPNLTKLINQNKDESLGSYKLNQYQW